MKKFISILTTACIAASSMVGATMSSVNAADTMLFTYKAADGTSTVTVDVSDGDATVDASLWITEYAPVYTMGLKMTWYGADGTGYLPEDNPYFTGTSVGYTDPHVFIDPIWKETVLYKIKNANALPMNFVWQMGTVGEDQSTPIDAVPSVDGEFQFIDMTFTVDADTPAGTYTLDIRRESFALDDQGTLSSTKLNNVAGETVEYNTVPLTIVVTNGEEEETTTTTTSTSEEEVTTTTTTQTTPDQGDTTTAPTIEGHTYQIGMVEVDLSTFADTDYIQVPVQVYGDTNTAGITMGLDVDETLAGSYVRYKVGDAYDGAPTFNKDTFYYVWSSSDGKNTTAADGATIITLWFKLPEGAAAGDVYPISFNFDMVVGEQEGEEPHIATQSVDENGKYLDIKYNNGWVKIVDGAGEEETTTTPAETTTTEEVTTTTTVEETTTTVEETTTTPAETTTTEEETTTTVPVGDVLPGDTNVDGRVSIADVVKLNKYLAGNDDLTDQGLANAEVNADGKIDNADSIKIMQFLAKMINQSELGKA